ncbi:hypothetical protein SPRG_13886 [Saprolegnia parasitica CBS 223.65]|uniref:Suppressor of forked domain-containing protein n=1 Tax=Saprolegnia parasitica (strain CBS 223.65) TaxID=695850 RepID=A0A067C2F0_SAPPC|nr:hypothetical protein SPRG_13886 [Saprolegnia parasitica CBS 223.65]KDO20992.1 hypothetical protein SPRG_13886 [Saprolegnia parasitica CBS 223.65]|eukprot:XP_012208304.1 hypothetical protein SPRG_13886 [Saprolegnia parasitica CBS 223.65]
MAGLPPLDATSVIATAKTLIISSNYLQVDSARATVPYMPVVSAHPPCTGFSTLEQYAQDTSSIGLWLAFAELEMELRQFKQATKVFELAVTKWPGSFDLWKRYIGFCLEREKFSNAKKLVLRALDTIHGEAEQAALWGLLEACTATQGDVAALRSQRIADTASASAPAPTAPTTAAAPTAPVVATTAAEPEIVVQVDAAKPTTPAVPHFKDIPMALPVIPDCKYLLFDPVDLAVTVPTPVLQMLSELLRDNNEHIFSTVFDMATAQRKQDVATLYRWQDLICMQMKEGADLFQRHHAENEKGDAASRDAFFAQQRLEFTKRCTMAQKQFVDIQGMTRKTMLSTQQRALQELRIPLMVVTTDHDMIAQQRKMTHLILEAEAVWRTQHPRATPTPAPTPKPTPAPSSYDRYSRESSSSRPDESRFHRQPEESRFHPRRADPPPMRAPHPSTYNKPVHHAPRSNDYARHDAPRHDPYARAPDVPRQEPAYGRSDAYGRHDVPRYSNTTNEYPPRQEMSRPEYGPSACSS